MFEYEHTNGCKRPIRFKYFVEDRVQCVKKLDETQFTGAVAGSAKEPYLVTFDLEYPKRSNCDGPFANGHKICKHMVALFFAAFPEEALAYKAAIDAAIQEEAQYREELPDRIERYVNGLTKAELRELILQLIDALPEWEFEQFVRDNTDADD